MRNVCAMLLLLSSLTACQFGTRVDRAAVRTGAPQPLVDGGTPRREAPSVVGDPCPQLPGCSLTAEIGTPVNVPNGTNQRVAFDKTGVGKFADIYNPSTGDFTPLHPGIYVVTWSLAFEAKPWPNDPFNNIATGLLKNDAKEGSGNVFMIVPPGTANFPFLDFNAPSGSTIHGSTTIELTEKDRVALGIYQNSGSDLRLIAGTLTATRIAAPQAARLEATLSEAKEIPNAKNEPIAFRNVLANSVGDAFDGTTGELRAPETGLYYATWSLAFAPRPWDDNELQSGLVVDGASQLSGTVTRYLPPRTASASAINGATAIFLLEGESVIPAVRQTSGGTLTATTGTFTITRFDDVKGLLVKARIEKPQLVGTGNKLAIVFDRAASIRKRYDTATGKFEAPAKGAYLVTWSLAFGKTAWLSPQSNLAAGIVVNGRAPAFGTTYSVIPTGAVTRSAVDGTAIVFLEEKDTISLGLYSSSGAFELSSGSYTISAMTAPLP